VYREERNVPEFVRRMQPILEAVTSRHEIVFAMDPSPDRTEAVILDLRRADPRIKLIKFSRRFGQPMATLAGMQYSSGAAVIVMDVDLQDPPELVIELVEKWRDGFDVVSAQRRSRRGETIVKRVVSWTGYRLINRIAEVPIPANTGDFRLMSRRVVDEVLPAEEHHGFSAARRAGAGFRADAGVLFDRPERFAGTGHYNRLLGSLRIGLNGVICFPRTLLSLSSTMGFLIAGISFVIGVVYDHENPRHPFPLGNPTIVILILFMGACS
jgi:dolichol-phosphate mannosyltransferase